MGPYLCSMSCPNFAYLLLFLLSPHYLISSPHSSAYPIANTRNQPDMQPFKFISIIRQGGLFFLLIIPFFTKIESYCLTLLCELPMALLTFLFGCFSYFEAALWVMTVLYYLLQTFFCDLAYVFWLYDLWYFAILLTISCIINYACSSYSFWVSFL